MPCNHYFLVTVDINFFYIVNWFPLVYYYYTKYEWDMVVGQEPAMGFSQTNFSLETSESKQVRFLAAVTAHDTKWLRHFSGSLTHFHSFSAAFPIIMCQCRESAAQSDPCNLFIDIPRQIMYFYFKFDHVETYKQNIT